MGRGGKAFIVLKPGETMNEGEVFEFLRGKVAKYKIPKYVEFVEELPKTSQRQDPEVPLERNGIRTNH